MSNILELSLAGAAAVLLLLVLLVAWGLVRSRQAAAARAAAAASERKLDAVDTITGWPPTPTRVMSKAERRAMQVLREALPDFIVLAQVPLARFLRVPERHSYADWMRRIGHANVDFVICDNAAQVIAAVEVRDPDGTESDKHRKRQQRMDRVLAAAGIKLHVWREASLPSPSRAREALVGAAAPVRGVVASQPQGLQKTTAPALLDEVHDVDARDDAADARASTWFDDAAPSSPAALGPTSQR